MLRRTLPLVLSLCFGFTVVVLGVACDAKTDEKKSEDKKADDKKADDKAAAKTEEKTEEKKPEDGGW